MCRPITIFTFLLVITRCLPSYSQGWVAEVDLDLNHDLYAYEKIFSATLTFSGVTITGSSATSSLNLVLRGNDPLSGDITLSIEGLASDPYERIDAQSKSISISYSGNFSDPCIKGFLQGNGATPYEHVTIWIRIYPRMEVSSFLQECDKLILTTNTCSDTLVWEVSDDLTENFRVIFGRSTPTITITRDELVALGFDNPFGRKYFRVTGLHMTTSQLQPVDIYYPGPSATSAITPVQCHNGNDGAVELSIISALPMVIDDYVATFFRVSDGLDKALEQEVIFNGSAIRFAGISPGSYKVRIENNSSIDIYGNCWIDHYFDVINPDPINISLSQIADYNGFQVSCNGYGDGFVEVIASGGTDRFVSYLWEPQVSETHRADHLAAGHYQVRVKDSNECWSDVSIFTIVEPESLHLELISTGGKDSYGVSCEDKFDGAIAVEVSGGVAEYEFAWADGPTAEYRTALGMGSYSVTVSDANGCQAYGSIDLMAPDPIAFSIAQLKDNSCPNEHAAVLEVQQVTNAIGAVRYSWSSGETDKTITSKPAGTYRATVSDDYGCSTSQEYTVEDPIPYNAEIVPSSDYNGMFIRCHGQQNGQLKATLRDESNNEVSAENYTWYKNGIEFYSGPTASLATDVGAGSYRVEIIYREVCTTNKTFLLTEPAAVDVDISTIRTYNGIPISCAGASDGAIQAQATGGTGEFVYSWNTGRTSRQLIDIPSGTFEVTVTDANGCRGSAEKQISEPDPLVSNIMIISNYNGQVISCANAEDGHLRASSTGGTEPVTFVWNPGGSAADLFHVSAGDYQLIAVDANGCRNESGITISGPTPVMASIIETSDFNGAGVSCHGASDGYLLADGQGGTGEYTFAWGGSAYYGSRYTNRTPGTYQVIVKDQNGCEDIATASLSAPPPLTLDIVEVRDVSCFNGNDGTIKLAAQGGIGPYTFSSEADDWQSPPLLTGLTAKHYTLVVRDRNDCRASIPQVIKQPDPISIRISKIDPAMCGDPTGNVSAVIEGGTAPLTFRWTNKAGAIIGVQSEISSLPSGIIMLTVFDKNACVATSSVGVPAIDGPTVRAIEISPATCSYSADGSASLAVDGNSPFAFHWPDEQSTPLATGLRKGDYLVEIKDSQNCVTTALVSVTAPDSLRVEITESIVPTCAGQCNGRISTLAKGGNGNYEYKWAHANGPSVVNICAGRYHLDVTDEKGCLASATLTLSEPDSIKVVPVMLKEPSCPETCDGSIALQVSGGTGRMDYSWSDGNIGPIIQHLCAGDHTVTVRDSNQCYTRSTIRVPSPQKTSIDLGGPVTLCEGQTYILDAGAIWTEYAWGGDMGFTDFERRIALTQPGTYWLSARDYRGCIVRDTFLLQTSDHLLSTSFLVASQAFIGDTVVLIDVTWPLPETIRWIIPPSMEMLADYGDILFGKFNTSGRFDVTLQASVGECRDELTKSIEVLEGSNFTVKQGRTVAEEFLKEFSLFPNPNDGVFDIVVEFTEESTVMFTIWNILTSRQVGHWKNSGSNRYFKKIDLRPTSPGHYALRIDFDGGTRYVRFIIR